MISGDNSDIALRKATLQDLDDIKRLVDQHKNELGFVIRGALEKSIQSSEVIVATGNVSALAGFIHYRHRKDGQTTLYNIVVNSAYRGCGVGRKLIDELRSEAQKRQQNSIFLKCPIQLPANDFYLHYGFTLLAQEKGKNRPLNHWSIKI